MEMSKARIFGAETATANQVMLSLLILVVGQFSLILVGFIFLMAFGKRC